MTNTISVGDLIDAGEASLQTGPFGTQFKAAEYTLDGTPMINVKNIGFGAINTRELDRVGPQTRERLKAHVVQAGDIVFGRKGAVERHAFIREDQEGWMQGSDCIRLRVSSRRFLKRYVSYVLLTPQHRQWMINQSSHGATMASLNQDILRRIELPSIAIADQERVVAILQGYDELIENNFRRIEILEETARAIYREWFVNFHFPGHEDATFVDSPTGPSPKEWLTPRIDETAELVRGRSYRKAEVPDSGGVPFFNLKCIDRGGGFRKSGIKRYTGRFSGDQQTRPGDIVVAVTDMTQERRVVARAARIPLLPEDFGVISLDLVRFVPRRVDRYYLYGMLRYSSFSEEIKNFANGANVLHLSPQRIGEYRFLLPPPAIQEKYSEVVHPLYALSDCLDPQIENLKETRDFLLPKLISGEIEVSDLDIDTSWLAA